MATGRGRRCGCRCLDPGTVVQRYSPPRGCVRRWNSLAGQRAAAPGGLAYGGTAVQCPQGGVFVAGAYLRAGVRLRLGIGGTAVQCPRGAWFSGSRENPFQSGTRTDEPEREPPPFRRHSSAPIVLDPYEITCNDLRVLSHTPLRHRRSRAGAQPGEAHRQGCPRPTIARQRMCRPARGRLGRF
jgi:hypothetical protein